MKLTANPAQDMHATWSPDGKKILFSSDRDGNEKVYVMNSDGTDQINLTNNPAIDWCPSWCCYPLNTEGPTSSTEPTPSTEYLSPILLIIIIFVVTTFTIIFSRLRKFND